MGFWGPGAARLTVESDAPYWSVYTESEDGICLAPQTAPPNAQLLGVTGDSYIETLFRFEEDWAVNKLVIIQYAKSKSRIIVWC